jgi:hypothetical protein
MLDLELIRDIILYKVNNQFDETFDVDIKETVLSSDEAAQYLIPHSNIGKKDKEFIIVYFERILVQEGYGSLMKSNAGIDDETTIDMCDYLSLLRQKKLKDIGL